MSQGPEHQEHQNTGSSLSAEGQAQSGLGDAPEAQRERDMRREIQQLRTELNTAGTAYHALRRELDELKERTTQPPAPPAPARPEPTRQFGGKLAPLSKINGRKAEQLRTWFELAPTYLRASGLEPESRDAVLFLVSHFDYPLTKWFIGFKRRSDNDEAGGFLTTSALKSACMEFHKERDPELTARDRLKTLQQTGSVLHYAHTMEEIFLSIPEHPESAKIHDFVFGLKAKIRESVQLANPITFVQAVRVAQEKENVSSNERGPAPMELGQMKETPLKNSPKKIKGPLNDNKKKILLKTGACFYCREQGHIARDCPSKPATSGN